MSEESFVATLESTSKPWYQSKTMWVNAIAGALALVEANTGIIAQLAGPNIYAWIAVLLPVANMGLRSITTSPVTVRKGKEE